MNNVIVNGVRVRPTSRRVRKQIGLGPKNEGTVIESIEGLPLKVKLDNGRVVERGVWATIDCDQTQAAYVEYIISGGCLTCFGRGQRNFIPDGNNSEYFKPSGCPQCGRERVRG